MQVHQAEATSSRLLGLPLVDGHIRALSYFRLTTDGHQWYDEEYLAIGPMIHKKDASSNILVL